ncbi:MAG: hypothetical protein D6696_21015 [Acidobacteria bacterium]|nr:MAG: hypothetical protein D6696_21015 [Acidobacteriota bacterium]
MSDPTDQKAMDFWYDFDNFFLWEASPQVQALIRRLFTGGETTIYLQFAASVADGTFPQRFIAQVEPHRAELDQLFELQAQILDTYFGSSPDDQQRAFELFGQGTLYDVRREKAVPYGFWPIHAMDADYAAKQPPIGYYTWYSFLRAYALLNAVTDGPLLTLATHIALAAAVQQFMKPKKIEGGVHSNPDNPPIAEDQLERFRRTYLPLDFAQLDQAFTRDNALGPRPKPKKFAFA